MNWKPATLIGLVGLSCGGPDESAREAGAGARPLARYEGEPRDGLLHTSPGVEPGYVLLAPLQSTNTYLIDERGEPVHEWKGAHKPGQAAYLTDAGTLLRACRTKPTWFVRGGQGGRLEELSWEGELLWEYTFASEEHQLHHDIEPLPNGNVLAIAWERKTRAEAIERGRDPTLVGEAGMWPDFIVELEPIRPNGARVVWEWHAWDHLVQDRDPERAGYGRIDAFPSRIDIHGDSARGSAPSAEMLARERELEREREEQLRALGYLASADEAAPGSEPVAGGAARPADWMHSNSIDYNAELDQILLSVRSFNEIWIIDHSTTTEEAAGSVGGRAGRGGELLYRWGNPRAYGAGRAIDRKLFLQHDAQWIAPGRPGAGNILLFNNGRRRPKDLFSAVLELEVPRSADGTYRLEPGVAAPPREPLWRYTAPERSQFYSGHVSGAQRLSNGNTLVCSGEQGWIFEVDPQGNVVWEYLNPFGRSGADDDQSSRAKEGRAAGPFGGQRRTSGYGGLFRAVRYPRDHPGLVGRFAAGDR